MKKFLSFVLAAVMVLALAACGESGAADDTKSGDASDMKKVKAGFICLHDEQSTYDLNFINAAKEVCEKLGIEYVIKTGIAEDQAAYEEACQLVEDEGCNYIFADSFGHEAYIIQAAKEYPDVQFSHATGTKAHTEKLPNYHNTFATIFEGRFLAGVAAGMKINEMIESGKITADQAKMGYVGAHPYAEVVSGYTSFYLGARYVCPTVTMDVDYTASWYDEAAEYEMAKKFIESGCVLISQHADSMGAPRACEEAGVPNVSYNGSTVSVGPNTYIVASRVNWVPFFEYSITQAAKGETYDYDYTGTLASGGVELFEINEKAAAAGTAEKIAEIKQLIADGTLHVFDTSTFTVGGAEITSYQADVDDMGDYVGETEVIADGYFHESEYRSAPYFDLRIDGITELQ